MIFKQIINKNSLQQNSFSSILPSAAQAERLRRMNERIININRLNFFAEWIQC